MQRLKPRFGLRAMQVSCMAFFLGDVVWDIYELASARTLPGPITAIHLLFESLAVAFLALSLRTELGYEHAMRSFGEDRQQRLSALRHCFDDLIRDRFEAWALSAAERDVALLAFRGLRICEIATLRGTREGTVKAQMSTVPMKITTTGQKPWRSN